MLGLVKCKSDHSHYSHHAPLTASQRLQAHKENALTERARWKRRAHLETSMWDDGGGRCGWVVRADRVGGARWLQQNAARSQNNREAISYCDIILYKHNLNQWNREIRHILFPEQTRFSIHLRVSIAICGMLLWSIDVCQAANVYKRGILAYLQ